MIQYLNLQKHFILRLLLQTCNPRLGFINYLKFEQQLKHLIKHNININRYNYNNNCFRIFRVILSCIV